MPVLAYKSVLSALEELTSALTIKEAPTKSQAVRYALRIEIWRQLWHLALSKAQ